MADATVAPPKCECGHNYKPDVVGRHAHSIREHTKSASHVERLATKRNAGSMLGFLTARSAAPFAASAAVAASAVVATTAAASAAAAATAPASVLQDDSALSDDGSLAASSATAASAAASVAFGTGVAAGAGGDDGDDVLEIDPEAATLEAIAHRAAADALARLTFEDLQRKLLDVTEGGRGARGRGGGSRAAATSAADAAAGPGGAVSI